jgi:hypothetical protein
MALAGHGSALKVVIDESTAMTAEATTALSAGLIFRITNAAKRLIDIEAELEVFVDGVEANPSTYTVNPLNGIIVFAATVGAGVVTVTGKYHTPVALVEVYDIAVQCGRTVLDKTSFDSGGVREKLAGLKDLSGSFATRSGLSEELVTGSGSDWSVLISSSDPLFILEFVFGSGAGETFRAYVVPDGLEGKAAVDDLCDTSFTFNGARISKHQNNANVRHLFALDNWT